jgi:hypothetical protein
MNFINRLTEERLKRKKCGDKPSPIGPEISRLKATALVVAVRKEPAQGQTG